MPTVRPLRSECKKTAAEFEKGGNGFYLVGLHTWGFPMTCDNFLPGAGFTIELAGKVKPNLGTCGPGDTACHVNFHLAYEFDDDQKLHVGPQINNNKIETEWWEVPYSASDVVPPSGVIRARLSIENVASPGHINDGPLAFDDRFTIAIKAQ